MQNETTGGMGYLIVRASTAGGALPVPGAAVSIRGNTPEQSGTLVSRITNQDGLTERIPLPAPPASLSGAPGTVIPFSTYNIEVSAEGYATNLYQNVPIFDRITALQPIELIPLSQNGQEGNYNPGSTLFFETENNQL